MTKGKWLSRALHVTIALSFILGAFVVAPSTVTADPGISKWEKQGTPTEDDKVILPGSDIVDFDVAGDGETIYAVGTWLAQCDDESWSPAWGPMDLNSEYQFPKLWKSTDGGITWSDETDEVLDADNLPDNGNAFGNNNGAEDFTFFSHVSVAPDDPDFVVVAGWSYYADGIEYAYDGNTRYYIPVTVVSENGGDDFYWMGCDVVMGIITALDVSMERDGDHEVAVGTWDWETEAPTQGGNYTPDNGKVWRFDGGSYSSNWINASDDYDGWVDIDAVVDLQFSPNFDVDDTLVALTIGDVERTGPNDYMGFWVQAGVWGSQKQWNGDAGLGGYPVLVEHDDGAIVAQIEPDLGLAPPIIHEMRSKSSLCGINGSVKTENPPKTGRPGKRIPGGLPFSTGVRIRSYLGGRWKTAPTGGRIGYSKVMRAVSTKAVPSTTARITDWPGWPELIRPRATPS